MIRPQVHIRPQRFFGSVPFIETFDEVKVDDQEVSEVTEEDVRKENWKWPSFDEWYDPRTGRKVRKAKFESVKKNNVVPFKVVHLQNSKDFYTTFVELSSQSLIKILRGVLPDNNEILNDAPRIEARDLFHVMEKLRDIASSESATESGMWFHPANNFITTLMNQV